jgi:hypothetical protein
VAELDFGNGATQQKFAPGTLQECHLQFTVLACPAQPDGVLRMAITTWRARFLDIRLVGQVVQGVQNEFKVTPNSVPGATVQLQQMGMIQYFRRRIVDFWFEWQTPKPRSARVIRPRTPLKLYWLIHGSLKPPCIIFYFPLALEGV